MKVSQRAGSMMARGRAKHAGASADVLVPASSATAARIRWSSARREHHIGGLLMPGGPIGGPALHAHALRH